MQQDPREQRPRLCLLLIGRGPEREQVCREGHLGCPGEGAQHPTLLLECWVTSPAAWDVFLGRGWSLKCRDR